MRLLILTSLLTGAGACSPVEDVDTETRGEMFARYRPAVEAKWAAAKAVFKLDPSNVSTGVVAGQPAPFAKRNAYTPADSNIAILPAALLLDGVKPELNLYFRSPLSDAHDYLTGSYHLYPDAPADAEFETSLQAAIATPYVGVYNIDSFEAPELIDDKTFKPGRVSFMFGVMDIANKSMVAACTISATSDERVDLPDKADWASRESHVKEQLNENARAYAAQCLADHTKGEFSFE